MAPPPGQGGVTQSLAKFVRMLALWYFATKFFGPKKPIDLSQLMFNSFRKGELLDMWVYLSKEAKFKDFGNEDALVWHETNVPYVVWQSAGSRYQILTYYPSEALQDNGSLYAHVFFARSGYTPDPNDPEYEPLFAFGRRHPVVMYLPKPKADKKKSLLGNQDSKEERSFPEVNDDLHDNANDEGHTEWVSYWKPNITINLIDDFTRWSGHFRSNAAMEVCLKERQMNSRVFLEGNPYLLAVTMVVSCLHSVFDFLAFKNDIQFWNKNKSMKGLSAKSVVIDRTGSFPKLRFRDRESYTMNKTKEYDDLAMKYLSYVSFLLVACSSIYSLMYNWHKSWYSWILSSLTTCVYMFGFIMMCPQLFINYKMKSVAHLPWRQMTYKFLNTIIDDLFAFVIKMPMLHCLSVFRDDIIFAIYLYQRWIYPVDKKRVNEIGFGGEDEDEDQCLASGDATATHSADTKCLVSGDATASHAVVTKRKRKKKKSS